MKKNVHFIAIGGSAMHNLALSLQTSGFEVTGSDDKLVDPSKSRLQAAGICPEQEGWFPEKIHAHLHAVILGMHARKDNPELVKARELNLPIYSYPEYILEMTRDKTRVAICGSHGKTTITSMILHVLAYHDQKVDYMVGAQLDGFDRMVDFQDDNEFAVIEGDEYLSSPLDLRPKFVHYLPHIALISGIAWDHVNVFKTEQQYIDQFQLLLEVIQPGGAVIYNSEDPKVTALVERFMGPIKKFPYALPDWSMESGRAVLHTPFGAIPLQVIGNHNMQNLEGARLISNHMGITDDQFYEAIPSFTGASRRLELIWNHGKHRVFRDFAHAPSKVQATVDAVVSASEAPVCAVLELHTFSSLSADFIQNYRGTMNGAAVSIVFFSPDSVAHKQLPELTKEQVADAFGDDIMVCTHPDELENAVRKAWPEVSDVLLMSSGSFNGWDYKSVLEALD